MQVEQQDVILNKLKASLAENVKWARKQSFFPGAGSLAPAALDLTPYDLRQTTVPDDSLLATYVQFQHEGTIYGAVHSSNLATRRSEPNTPAILLYTKDKRSRAGLSVVSTRIATIVAGKPEGLITEREDDIATLIKLTAPTLTQQMVADFTDGYRNSFGGVSIPVAYYLLAHLNVDNQEATFPLTSLGKMLVPSLPPEINRYFQT